MPRVGYAGEQPLDVARVEDAVGARRWGVLLGAQALVCLGNPWTWRLAVLPGVPSEVQGLLPGVLEALAELGALPPARKMSMSDPSCMSRGVRPPTVRPART